MSISVSPISAQTAAADGSSASSSAGSSTSTIMFSRSAVIATGVSTGVIDAYSCAPSSTVSSMWHCISRAVSGSASTTSNSGVARSSGESRIAARGGGTPARREAATVEVRNCGAVARSSYAVAPTKRASIAR